MPIYEFYCADCHTIYSFFSRRVNTEKRPACPKCARPDLERRMSMFSISKARNEGADDPPDLDDHKLERALASMAGDMDGLDGEDPRAAARMMRRLFDAGGLKVGSGMEEALRRMEAGEDPDQIEADMGDVLEDEGELLEGKGPKGKAGLTNLRRLLPPRVDETLYDL